MPRLLASALWLVVTVASTAMVWTATSIVAGDVTDRPASVLAQSDVVSELESGPPVPATTPTSAPPPSSSTSTAPPRGRTPAPTVPGDPGPPPAPDPAPQPAPPVVPSPPATTPATAPSSPPTTRAGSSPPTQPQGRTTATYSTAGGVVRVACNGLFIQLVSAIPTNGYAADVVAAGPANVEVHFVRGGQDLAVKVVCFNQPIRY